nr:uncharacterized membrane protein At1g16860-like [Tanacetum cinerariifolium]
MGLVIMMLCISLVVICGCLPLGSAFQKVRRCVHISMELYEFKGWRGKSANPKNQCFSWGCRDYEVESVSSQYNTGGRMSESGNMSKRFSQQKKAQRMSSQDNMAGRMSDVRTYMKAHTMEERKSDVFVVFNNPLLNRERVILTRCENDIADMALNIVEKQSLKQVGTFSDLTTMKGKDFSIIS